MITAITNCVFKTVANCHLTLSDVYWSCLHQETANQPWQRQTPGSQADQSEYTLLLLLLPCAGKQKPSYHSQYWARLHRVLKVPLILLSDNVFFGVLLNESIYTYVNSFCLHLYHPWNVWIYCSKIYVWNENLLYETKFGMLKNLL